MSSRVYSATERAAEAAATIEDSADKEEKIPDFPAECLPPILELEARAISELCGVPLGMSGPMVIAVASAALGKAFRVRSLPGRITPANLFVLVCKTSGSGGSLTFKHATAPLLGMQKTLRREFEEKEKPRLEAQFADVSAQIEKLKKELKNGIAAEEREQIIAELAELIAKRTEIETNKGKLVFATDVTPEKLAEMLAEHGETLAHIDSDAADALGIITGDRYGDGKHTQESVWLKGYTGEPTVIFRKHGDPVHLIAPCLAILFVATPDKVQELFRNSRLTSGGLLPRFLVCDPAARPIPLEAGAATSHTLPTEVSQPYEAAIFAAISRHRLSGADDPDEIDMTFAARNLFIEDWNGFCAKSNGTEDCPFEARHTENAIRIAVVLHAFKHVTIEEEAPGTFHAQLFGHEPPLDEHIARDALQIRDWFNLHQDRLRMPQRADADNKAWDKAQEMMRDRSALIGITSRDLYNGRCVCRDANEAHRLLKQWEDLGRVEPFERKPAEGAGRPTTAYRLALLGRR